MAEPETPIRDRTRASRGQASLAIALVLAFSLTTVLFLGSASAAPSVVSPSSITLEPTYMHPERLPSTIALSARAEDDTAVQEIRVTAPLGVRLACTSDGDHQACSVEQSPETDRWTATLTYTPPEEGSITDRVRIHSASEPFNVSGPSEHGREDPWDLTFTSRAVSDTPSGTNPTGTRTQQATLYTIVDTRPPSSEVELRPTGSNPGGWHDHNISVRVHVQDEDSGPQLLHYTTDDSDPRDPDNPDRRTTRIGSHPITVLHDRGEGNHTFRWAAEDRMGNLETHPGRITFTVDKTPPTLDRIHPANGSIHETRTVPVRFHVTDQLAGRANLTLTCQLDDGQAKPCSSAVEHVFTIPEDGPHTAMVRATDPAGNIATLTSPFVVDTQAPELGFTDPPTWVPANQTTIRYHLTDANLGHPATTLTCTLDDGPGTPCSSRQDHTYSELADGPHTVRVTAVDPAGHEATREHTFTVDTQPPALELETPSEQAHIDPPAQARFTVDDAHATHPSFETACVLDGQPIEPCGPQDPIPLEALDAGPHTIALTAVDPAGHKDRLERAFHVDMARPEITIEHPVEGGALQLGKPEIRFQATDPDTPRSKLEATCQLDDDPPRPCDSLGNHTFGSATPGQHTFTVRVQDPVGHTGERTVTALVDPEPPRILEARSPSHVRATVPFEVDVAATDDVGLGSLVWLLDGHALTERSLKGTNATETSTLRVDQAGDHVLTLRVLDDAGHATEQSFDLTVGLPPEEPEHASTVPSGHPSTGSEPSTTDPQPPSVDPSDRDTQGSEEPEGPVTLQPGTDANGAEIHTARLTSDGGPLPLLTLPDGSITLNLSTPHVGEIEARLGHELDVPEPSLPHREIISFRPQLIDPATRATVESGDQQVILTVPSDTLDEPDDVRLLIWDGSLWRSAPLQAAPSEDGSTAWTAHLDRLAPTILLAPPTDATETEPPEPSLDPDPSPEPDRDTEAPTLDIQTTLQAPLAQRTPIHVVAADDTRVQATALLVDGRELDRDATSPYQLVLDPTTLEPGEHELTVLAWDRAGNEASHTLTVRTLAPADGTQVLDPASTQDPSPAEVHGATEGNDATWLGGAAILLALGTAGVLSARLYPSTRKGA